MSAKRPRAFWLGFAAVFLLALFPRLLHPVSRPLQWYDRSVCFWDALLAGDLEGTYQQYHPGVTVMWIAGLGLRVYAAAHGWSGEDLESPPPTSAGIEHYPIEAGVAALSLAIAACIGLAYVLLTRLADWPAAFAGGCFLALDPFHIAESKILHLDALLASLMLVSALFLLCYLRLARPAHLVLSGVFAGLAFLTKSPAGFLLPYALLATAAFAVPGLRGRDRGIRGAGGSRRWWQRAWGIARIPTIWGAASVLVFVLLWPATWYDLLGIVERVIEEALFRVETPHELNYFAGRVSAGDPGWLYYVATVGWKTTLVTLPAICLVVFLLLRQSRRWQANASLWWMLVYAGGFSLMMTISAKKGLRYLLPAFPALDVLAGWGLAQAAGSVRRWRGQRLTWAPAATITAALLVQAGIVLAHHPYYGTHHNLLLGGSRVAQRVLPLGDQGEGLDVAARFLSGYPGAERMVAGVQERSAPVFRQNFVGRTRPIELRDADYWVFDVNTVQRGYEVERWGQMWQASQATEPLYVVSFDGVPYVWVYRAYQHDSAAFDIERQVDARLGEHVRLLGGRLSEDSVSAGETLTVTLFWQSDGRVVGDYSVFVHLLDAGGALVAQDDGAPARGERPTWSWRDAEVIQDEHVLAIDAGLREGTFTLSAGMYDWATGDRLPAVGPDGERLADGCVQLGVLQSPSSPCHSSPPGQGRQ